MVIRRPIGRIRGIQKEPLNVLLCLQSAGVVQGRATIAVPAIAVRMKIQVGSLQRIGDLDPLTVLYTSHKGISVETVLFLHFLLFLIRSPSLRPGQRPTI